ncbi:MAG: SDR family NAD(P)-dependent oxidoreductase, partial [Rhodospirillales bacterium]|nr:SDR family NAD(P)-dependent oxidoreductase [Rhodospirillales bacterium]
MSEELKLPDIDLDGRVVIMTGASRGLGRSMVVALAKTGARVVLAAPDIDALNGVAEEIKSAVGKGRALVVETDITDLKSCENCLAQTLDGFGGLDVLINNARRLHRGPGLPASG